MFQELPGIHLGISMILQQHLMEIYVEIAHASSLVAMRTPGYKTCKVHQLFVTSFLGWDAVLKSRSSEHELHW